MHETPRPPETANIQKMDHAERRGGSGSGTLGHGGRGCAVPAVGDDPATPHKHGQTLARRGGARGWSARWGLLSGRARTFIVSRFVKARVWDRGTVEDEPAACSGRGRCRRSRQLPRPAPLSPPLGDSAAFRWPKRPRGGGRRASPCVTGGTGRPSAPGRAGWDGRERGKQPGSRFWWWSHPSTAVRVCAQVRAGSHVCRTSHTRGP